jgi:hypothetical protein
VSGQTLLPLFLPSLAVTFRINHAVPEPREFGAAAGGAAGARARGVTGFVLVRGRLRAAGFSARGSRGVAGSEPT